MTQPKPTQLKRVARVVVFTVFAAAAGSFIWWWTGAFGAVLVAFAAGLGLGWGMGVMERRQW